jgi:hypothetical protein
VSGLTCRCTCRSAAGGRAQLNGRLLGGQQMPNGHEWSLEETRRIKGCFARLEADLEAFAAAGNLSIDCYYHDSPSWGFRFRHPLDGSDVKTQDAAHIRRCTGRSPRASARNTKAHGGLGRRCIVDLPFRASPVNGKMFDGLGTSGRFGSWRPCFPLEQHLPTKVSWRMLAPARLRVSASWATSGSESKPWP